MNLLKRPEVILLLLLAAGGAVFVLTSTPGNDRDDPSQAEALRASSTADAETRIHRLAIERDYGNARLDIDIQVANRDPKRLVMQPPEARLFTGKGREVPPFFLPFSPPPEIAANAAADVQLRYWLEKADLEGSLRLEIRGESIEVKSAAPFDLEKLENKQPRTLAPGEWKL